MNNEQKMQDVERKIQEEFNKFNAEIYQGIVPKGFITYFKKAFMAAAPNSHKMYSSVVKSISEKKEEELTNLEVALSCNLISSVPLDKVYENFDKSIKCFTQVENMRIDYNLKVAAKQKELDAKKETLINLSGVNLSKSKIFQA